MRSRFAPKNGNLLRQRPVRGYADLERHAESGAAKAEAIGQWKAAGTRTSVTLPPV